MIRLILLMTLATLVTAPAGCGAPPKGPATTARATTTDDDWRSQRPASGPPAELHYPSPDLYRLDNGLTVVLLQRPAGVTSVSLVIKRFAGLLPPGKSGLDALTTRMLSEGTSRRTSLELAEAIADLGTTLEYETGRDATRLSLLVLPQDVEPALELLADMAQRPAFDERDFARVRTEWLDGLRAERQNPMRLASLAGLRLALGEQHGGPIQGSLVDVEGLAVRDLVSYHARAFAPQNSALVVVGDVEWPMVRAAASRHFDGWRCATGSEPPVQPLPAAPAQPRIALVDRPDAVQTALFVIQPFPARSASGHEARQVLSGLLGGLFTSRINQNLRERHGYTYGASTRAVATREWGALIVTTAAETKHTAAALWEILSELRQAKTPALGRPIEVAEVDRAKAGLRGSLAENLLTVDAVASDLAELFEFDLDREYYSHYGQTLATISAQQVQLEASRHLTPEHVVVVAVGDRASVESNLRIEGVTVETATAALLR